MAEEELAEHNNEIEHQILERILGLKQFIQIDGGEGRDFHELGICYFMLHNYSQAIDYLDQIIKIESDYDNLAAAIALQVLCYLEMQHYADANSLCQEALKSYPEDERLLGMQAYTLDRMGKRDQAIEYHRRVLSINPDNPNSLNSLGYLLVQRGTSEDIAEASQHLKEALRLRPDTAAYLDSLGVLLMKQGKFKGAEKAISMALKKMPQNAEILEHLRDLMQSEKEGQ